MRNVIAVVPGLVDTEMARGTKGEHCEPIVLRNWVNAHGALGP